MITYLKLLKIWEKSDKKVDELNRLFQRIRVARSIGQQIGYIVRHTIDKIRQKND